jgi:hypothetical protein
MKFERIHPWAVLPRQRTVDIDAAKERERVYRETFRHLRAARQPEFCSPWVLGGTGLAMDKPPWLHLYEFREGDGWGSMFIPNGQGSVEWRQGWLPDDFQPHAIMVFPSEELPELGVLTGVLTATSIERMRLTGFSIAISPRVEVPICRGQEIARMVLVGPESLRTS